MRESAIGTFGVVYYVCYLINSSHRIDFTNAGLWAGFSWWLVFTWAEPWVGDAQIAYDRVQLPGQQSPQDWDVVFMAPKRQSSHLGSSHRCSMCDGKLFSCLEYKKRIHQLYHYWYVFTTLQVQIYIPIWQIVVTLFIAILFLPYLYRAVNMYLLCWKTYYNYISVPKLMQI